VLSRKGEESEYESWWLGRKGGLSKELGAPRVSKARREVEGIQSHEKHPLQMGGHE